jgi:hypothetical protein
MVAQAVATMPSTTIATLLMLGRSLGFPDDTQQEIANFADAAANMAMPHRILAFKSNIELKDQVQYLRTELGKAAALENSKKGTTVDQLLSYLDSCDDDVSYLFVFDKVNLKLLQKGRPSKKQNI